MRINHKALITKENGKLLNSPGKVFNLFKRILAMESRLDKDKEHIWIAGLTRNNSIKYIELVHLGTIDKCTVGIKDILRTAVYYCCSSIIMCHNHPGGTIKPSSNDFRVTKAVKEAANILEINLLDSIIIGSYYYSFSENDVL